MSFLASVPNIPYSQSLELTIDLFPFFWLIAWLVYPVNVLLT